MIILIILTLILILELATRMNYGGFVSKQVTDIYMNLDTTDLRLNSYDPTILSTQHFITNLPIRILSKYYINGLGTVPRWSKLHKRIKEYYKIALENEFK